MEALFKILHRLVDAVNLPLHEVGQLHADIAELESAHAPAEEPAPAPEIPAPVPAAVPAETTGAAVSPAQ